MAATPGKLGSILYDGGSVAKINNFDIPVVNDMLDVTAFTTSAPQWREFVPGLSGWSGSVNGLFDPTSTGQNDLITNSLSPTTATIVLELDQVAGGKFTGPCYLSGMSPTVAIDGTAEISWSVQGTSALAYTTTT